MSNEELTELALQIYVDQQRRKPALPLEAQFYPYANLNHTVRLRCGKIFFRISDVMQDAPRWALRAIIAILLLKLNHRKITPELQATYRSYAGSQEVRHRIHQIRRQRAQKLLSLNNGKYFDLRTTFDRLNRQYFQSSLRVSLLTWSARKTRRTLGHYDHFHDAIVISRSLDTEWVPLLLFEFILFHEMLHAYSGERYHNGKRYAHHREFRIREKTFHRYREAQELMKQFSARIR
ncbi:MAG: hypothetical protein HY644_08945 [Acidobacteria bacterium]|nr:hypothetical protein [Acidobacteriota bacterium]